MRPTLSLRGTGGAGSRRAPHTRRGAELLRLVETYRDAGTPQGQHAADIALHEAVLQVTHNPRIALLSHELLAKVSLGLPIEPYERRNHLLAADEHATLVEAVVERARDRRSS